MVGALCDMSARILAARKHVRIYATESASNWVWRDLLALACELNILSHEIIAANVCDRA